jgi:hypothetical protein
MQTQKSLRAEKDKIVKDYEVRVVNLKQQLGDALKNDYDQLELIDVLQQQLISLNVEPLEVQREQETATAAAETAAAVTAEAVTAAAVTATAAATVAAVVAAAVAAAVAETETRDEQPLSA